MSQHDIDVVRRVIAHVNDRGEAGPAELFDPDVTFTTRGDLGGAETFTGLTGVARAVAMFGEVWAKTTAHVVDLIEGDHVVVALVRIELRSRAGVDLEVEEAWAYWLRDGKIVRIEQHGAVAQALEAAELSR
jgi:ketosteroid isomerase-like protein